MHDTRVSTIMCVYTLVSLHTLTFLRKLQQYLAPAWYLTSSLPRPHSLRPAAPRRLTSLRCGVLFPPLCVQLPEIVDLEPLDVKLPRIDADSMAFLQSTLRYEPSTRATCSELLASPFFEGFEEWFMPVCTAALWSWCSRVGTSRGGGLPYVRGFLCARERTVVCACAC